MRCSGPSAKPPRRSPDGAPQRPWRWPTSPSRRSTNPRTSALAATSSPGPVEFVDESFGPARALRTVGTGPWTTPPRCPPPAPTRAPLAHELHRINNKFSMKRKNRKTRPFNLPLTSSSVALVQHFQHRQNKVPTTSPDRKTDSPPNSSVQAHVLIGKRFSTATIVEIPLMIAAA